MFKKMISLVCVGTMIITLAGCQNSQSSKDSKKDDGHKKETVTIMWQQEVSEKFWDLPISKFNEKYPDVEVKLESNAKAYEVIRNLLNIKQAPDIFYSWISDVDYYGFAKEGLLYPVDDILAEQNNQDTATLNDTIFQAGLKLGELDGKHYFLPTSKLIAGNFYSGKLFKEKGWEVPETWNEFQTLCDTIKKDGQAAPMIYAGVYPFMLADAFLIPTIANMDPAALDAINNNEPGAWKTPAALEAVKRLQEMRDKGYIDKNSLAMDHIQSQIDFIGNNDVFVPSGSWLEGEMEDQWPEDFDLQPMFAPGEEAQKTSTTAVVECMVLPKQKSDTNLKYVKELVKLFYSEENIKYAAEQTGFLLATESASDEVIKSLPQSAQTMWKMADDNVNLITPSYKVKYKEVLSELNNCINALIQEEIDAAQFCDRMDKSAQENSSEKK